MNDAERERFDRLERFVSRSAATEGALYMARLLLRDWLDAEQIEQSQQRHLALLRVAIETRQFLATLPDYEAGAPGGRGEATPGAPRGDSNKVHICSSKSSCLGTGCCCDGTS
jgi:hypothetical protein